MNDPLYDLGEKEIKSNLTIVNKIYVDLSFLKYIGAGRVLSHDIMNDELYLKVVDILGSDEFINRTTDLPNIVFKSIDNFDDIFNNLNNTDDDTSFLMSPLFMGSYEELVNHLASNKHGKTVTNDKTNTVVYFNLDPLTNISESLINRLTAEYNNTFSVDVKIINKPFDSMSDDEIMSFDSFFMNTLTQFTDRLIDLLDKRELVDKYLFCKRELPLDKLEDPDRFGIDNILDGIESVMAFATKFKYVKQPTCLT